MLTSADVSGGYGGPLIIQDSIEVILQPIENQEWFQCLICIRLGVERPPPKKKESVIISNADDF